MKKIPLLLLLLSTAAGLRAQTTFQLSGTISSVSGTDEFAVGNPFTITVSYNPEITDTNPGNESSGFYPEAITSFEFKSGDYVGTAAGGRFEIFDNVNGPYDEAQMAFADIKNFPTVDTHEFNLGTYFHLKSNSETLFSSDHLPAIFPTTGWNSGDFTLGWGENSFNWQPLISLRGNITSVSAVPEPATTAMLVGALALGAALAWRRRQCRS